MDEKNIQSEDYVNTSGLKGITVEILNFIFSVCITLISPFIKRKSLLLVGAIVGLIAGFSYYKTKPSFYEVSMIVESTHLNYITVSEVIKQLDKLAHSGTKENLSRELKIDEDQAKQIILIDSRSMANESLAADTSQAFSLPFKIIADIKENRIADTLQNGIITYLNSKPYLTKIIENEKKIYIDKLLFIQSELSKLDSLKTGYNRFLTTSKISATIYNNALNPSEIYIHSLNLINQKEIILKWLNNSSEAFSVIDGFKSSRVKKSISFRNALLIFGAIGLGIGYLIGLLLELRRKIKYYK
jgi:hypothetical protein